MKVFLDENIPLMTGNALIKMGHDILDIRGTSDEGMTDDLIWKRVQQEKRVLITADKGFTRFREEHHHDILIVKLRQPNRHEIHQRVIQAMS